MVRSRRGMEDNEHSHTTATRQPSRISAVLFLRSRALFALNFDLQKSGFAPGMRPRWQECPCQKHPWTNTTALSPGNTKSGRPGRPLECSRYRNPSAHTALRTTNSGLVSLERMSDIRALLSAVVRESAMDRHATPEFPCSADRSHGPRWLTRPYLTAGAAGEPGPSVNHSAASCELVTTASRAVGRVHAT